MSAQAPKEKVKKVLEICYIPQLKNINIDRQFLNADAEMESTLLKTKFLATFCYTKRAKKHEVIKRVSKHNTWKITFH